MLILVSVWLGLLCAVMVRGEEDYFCSSHLGMQDLFPGRLNYSIYPMPWNPTTVYPIYLPLPSYYEPPVQPLPPGWRLHVPAPLLQDTLDNLRRLQ
jgi:hypothetical protein